MGRKADQFRAQQERAQQRPKKKRVARRVGAATARPAVSNQTNHNAARRTSKRYPYELEESAGARPPRKGTRKSPEHLKTDSALRLTAVSMMARPSARATHGRGGPR